MPRPGAFNTSPSRCRVFFTPVLATVEAVEALHVPPPVALPVRCLGAHHLVHWRASRRDLPQTLGQQLVQPRHDGLPSPKPPQADTHPRLRLARPGCEARCLRVLEQMSCQAVQERGSRGRLTKEVWDSSGARAWAWRPAGSNAGRSCRPAALSPNRSSPPYGPGSSPRAGHRRSGSTPVARGKAILCSQQSLNRAVEVARAGITKGHFPSDGAGVRAATPLFSDGASNNGYSCRTGPRAHGALGPVLCSTTRIRGVSVSVR